MEIKKFRAHLCVEYETCQITVSNVELINKPLCQLIAKMIVLEDGRRDIIFGFSVAFKQWIPFISFEIKGFVVRPESNSNANVEVDILWDYRQNIQLPGITFKGVRLPQIEILDVIL